MLSNQTSTVLLLWPRKESRLKVWHVSEGEWYYQWVSNACQPTATHVHDNVERKIYDKQYEWLDTSVFQNKQLVMRG